MVFAYGERTAKDAASPAGTLGDYQVSSYRDADWQDARPYLEPLTALVAGTTGSGDELRSAFKFVVK